MIQKTMTTEAITETIPRINNTKRFLRVFLGRGLVIFGLVIVVIFILTAIVGPLLAPYEPNQINPSQDCKIHPGSTGSVQNTSVEIH